MDVNFEMMQGIDDLEGIKLKKEEGLGQCSKKLQ